MSKEQARRREIVERLVQVVTDHLAREGRPGFSVTSEAALSLALDRAIWGFESNHGDEWGDEDWDDEDWNDEYEY